MKKETPETDMLIDSLKGPAALAFSGGLDSSFLAFLSQQAGITINAHVVGLPDSHDIKWASRAASLLDIPLKKIIIDSDDIVSGAIEVRKILHTDDIVTISFELPLYFVCGESKEDIIMTGQGADELFGGYKRYESMSPEELEKEMGKDLSVLIEEGINRDKSIVSAFGKNLITPYLDPLFVEKMTAYTAVERRGPGRKMMLREMAVKLGLPEELAMKEKKAAQYGSGIMKVLKKNRNLIFL